MARAIQRGSFLRYPAKARTCNRPLRLSTQLAAICTNRLVCRLRSKRPAISGKKLANGAAVCGPHLAWRDGATIKRTEYTIDEKYLAVKALPDQWSFLRSGPFATTWSPFGSGECGGCEVLNFDLFAVSPLGEIASALHIEQDL